MAAASSLNPEFHGSFTHRPPLLFISSGLILLVPGAQWHPVNPGSWRAGEQVRLARPKADVMPGREGVLEIIPKVHTLAHSIVLTVKLLNPGQLPTLCATLQSTGHQRCQFPVGLTDAVYTLSTLLLPCFAHDWFISERNKEFLMRPQRHLFPTWIIYNCLIRRASHPS